MLPMLAGQRIGMQQVRRQSVRTALHPQPTLAITKQQTNAVRAYTMSSTATVPKKKELAMPAGEELPTLTRWP